MESTLPGVQGPIQPLSVQLRAGTRAAHRRLQDVVFIQSFLHGMVDLDSYRRMLVQLRHIYDHLEANLQRHAQHPLLEPLCLPALWRHEALAADLAVIMPGPGPGPCPSPSPATRRYGARIDFIGQQHPALLLAHAYARYLGDLSGGQMLGDIAARVLHLDPQHGLAFYTYPQIPKLGDFKQEYRARLDRLPVGEALAKSIVAEAVLALTLNRAMFVALSPRPGERPSASRYG